MSFLNRMTEVLAFLCRVFGVTPETIENHRPRDDEARQWAAMEQRAIAHARTVEGLRKLRGERTP